MTKHISEMTVDKILKVVESRLGLFPLRERITVLEESYVKAIWYEEISEGTSGKITPPEGGMFVLDQWEEGVDAVTSKLGSDDLPNFESAATSEEDIITATLDVNGNWTISDTPSSYPIALVFVYEIKRSDYDPTKSLEQIQEGAIISTPPSGHLLVTNIYVNANNGKLVVEYDDAPVT